MELLTELQAGFIAAGNGTAQIYRRGTSTPVVYYNDFEGYSAVASGTAVVLDSRGAAEVYVNEIVTVKVYDSQGALQAEYEHGGAAPLTEVRSLSFTGSDYNSAAIAAGNPTTLQAVLDLVIASFGTTNFNVLVNGSSSTLSAALGGVLDLFFNVKAAAYGAVGDGVNDDAAAIQAAMAAAATAGGGTVYFPPGNYRTLATLSLPSDVNMLGSGSNGSIIAIDSASLDLLSLPASVSTPVGPHYVSGLGFASLQSNTGKVISNASDADTVIERCAIGDVLNAVTAGLVGSVTGGTGKTTYRDCTFKMSGAGTYSSDGVATSTLFDSCYFLARPSARTAPIMRGFGVFNATNCTFDCTLCPSGTYTIIDAITNLVDACTLVGNRFLAGTGTVTAIATPDVQATNFMEAGSEFVGFSTSDVKYAWTYDDSGAPADVNSVASTRENSWEMVSSVSATPTVDSAGYGNSHLTSDSGTASLTVEIGAAYPGARFTLSIYNANATGLTSVILQSGGSTINNTNAVVTVATSKFVAYTMTYMHLSAGLSSWVVTGQQDGT